MKQHEQQQLAVAKQFEAVQIGEEISRGLCLLAIELVVGLLALSTVYNFGDAKYF